ncbi:MAG: hypothetical protein II338_02860, partial [Bacteroidaceae bacterium]|nr:hypothetical protein [Bacteroidaceae bacterium]
MNHLADFVATNRNLKLSISLVPNDSIYYAGMRNLAQHKLGVAFIAFRQGDYNGMSYVFLFSANFFKGKQVFIEVHGETNVFALYAAIC